MNESEPTATAVTDGPAGANAAAGGGRRVVFCQSGYYSAHRQRPHHLAAAAARAGWEVTFVVPTNWLALVRARWFRCRELRGLPFELRHLCVLAPERLQRRGGLVAARARRAMERRVADMRGEFADAPVIVEGPHFPQAVLEWERASLILDVHDDFLHMSGAEARTRERRLAAGSDTVVVSSPQLRQAFEGEADRLHCVPNGVDAVHYSGVSDLTRTARRAVFMGTLGPWVDCDLMAETARALPEWELLVVGSGSEEAAPRDGWPPNVKFLGRTSYRNLPAVLSRCSVGLIPFRTDDPVARAADTLKLYEYLAAGLAAVGTPIPQVERFDGRAGVLAAEGAGFAAAVTEARRLIGKPRLREQARRVVKNNSWQHRWRAFEDCFAAAQADG